MAAAVPKNHILVLGRKKDTMGSKCHSLGKAIFPKSAQQTSALGSLIITGSQGYPYPQGRLGSQVFARLDSPVELDWEEGV